MDPPLLSERQAAARLNARPDTLRRWRTQGRGPAHIRLGRLVRYRPTDVETFIESRRCPDRSDRSPVDLETESTAPEGAMRARSRTGSGAGT